MITYSILVAISAKYFYSAGTFFLNQELAGIGSYDLVNNYFKLLYIC